MGMAGYTTRADYAHVEGGLIESVTIRETHQLDKYPSGWDYGLHLGTTDGLELLRYDNAHESTKGHERHAGDDQTAVEFPGMEPLLVRFWVEADSYWDTADGDPPRPY